MTLAACVAEKLKNGIAVVVARAPADFEAVQPDLDFVRADLINAAGERGSEFVHPVFPIFQMEKAHTLDALRREEFIDHFRNLLCNHT